MVNGKNAAYDGYPLLSVNHNYIHNYCCPVNTDNSLFDG